MPIIAKLWIRFWVPLAGLLTALIVLGLLVQATGQEARADSKRLWLLASPD